MIYDMGNPAHVAAYLRTLPSKEMRQAHGEYFTRNKGQEFADEVRRHYKEKTAVTPARRHHEKHRMHENSLQAKKEEAVKLNQRAQAVMDYLKRGPCTDREVMTGLGFSDPNAVRPRITELIERGLVEECGNKLCPVTEKTVRVVRLVQDPAQKKLI